MTEQVEKLICIKFYIKLEYSSTETIGMNQKAATMGNSWLASSTQQHTCSCIMSYAEIFVETSNHPDDSAPLQPRFDTLWLLAFPKTKTKIMERENISDHWWDSGKYDGAADGNWENCVRSQGSYLKGTEASLSHVQCFLYLVSSSINVFVFHMTWLDTFWTDHVCVCVCDI